MIDLGRSMEESCGACEIKRDAVMYPSFHVSGKEKLDIPEEGEMTIKYKKVSSSHSKREDGGEHYDCTIDVIGIVSAEGEEVKTPTKNGSKDTEDALDQIAKTVMAARKSGKSSY